VHLGEYEIQEELGRGGAGVVYRAHSAVHGDVAVKVLRRASDEALARFDRERRVLSELGETAGFVPLLDAGASSQGPYVVMPFMAGGSLAHRLRRGPLALDEALALGRTLARALARAHARGVVHRDVKPDNVLFDASGRVLVSDLGLAKHFASSDGTPAGSQLTRTGELRGTPGFAPPEQLRETKEAGPPADVFALGAVLYECLTGQRAFGGETTIAVLERVERGDFTQVRAVRPEVPEWLAAVVERALASEAHARFADGAALLAALEPAAAPRRSWGPAAALAAMLALGVVVVLLATPATPVGDRTLEPPEPPAPPPEPPPPPPDPPPPPGPPARTPAWYQALPAADRPALPLPGALVFGRDPGEYVNPEDGSVLVYVSGGTFAMGSEDGRENERPVHEVEVSPFFIGKVEATVDQFRAFVAATGHVTGNETYAKGFAWNQGNPAGDLPVVNVSWQDARAYVAWAGLDLPSEAEWELAAGWDPRAKHARRFAWGDEAPSAASPLVGNLADESWRKENPKEPIFEGYDDGFAHLAPVGRFPAGASPWGLLDATGNANEWCLDVADSEFYARSPRKDPVAREGSSGAVARGGSYRFYSAASLANAKAMPRIAFRQITSQREGKSTIGFRVALPVTPR
jgi:formylglycine-generating enzyme required for sulfatase activity